MPQIAATSGIDYMNRKQIAQLARTYGVSQVHTLATTPAALIAAVKAK